MSPYSPEWLHQVQTYVLNYLFESRMLPPAGPVRPTRTWPGSSKPAARAISLWLCASTSSPMPPIETDYSHTSVNWCRRGMTPKWPVPKLLAQAIGERIGRPVNLSEIGMGEAETIDASVGLDFPRPSASPAPAGTCSSAAMS